MPIRDVADAGVVDVGTGTGAIALAIKRRTARCPGVGDRSFRAPRWRSRGRTPRGSVSTSRCCRATCWRPLAGVARGRAGRGREQPALRRGRRVRARCPPRCGPTLRRRSSAVSSVVRARSCRQATARSALGRHRSCVEIGETQGWRCRGSASARASTTSGSRAGSRRPRPRRGRARLRREAVTPITDAARPPRVAGRARSCSRPTRCTASAPSPDDPAATARVFEAKGRSASLALPVLVRSVEAAPSVSRRFDERADALAAACWPGALTLVLPRTPAERVVGPRRRPEHDRAPRARPPARARGARDRRPAGGDQREPVRRAAGHRPARTCRRPSVTWSPSTCATSARSRARPRPCSTSRTAPRAILRPGGVVPATIRAIPAARESRC